jgi:hypothetical protein
MSTAIQIQTDASGNAWSELSWARMVIASIDAAEDRDEPPEPARDPFVRSLPVMAKPTQQSEPPPSVADVTTKMFVRQADDAA